MERSARNRAHVFPTRRRDLDKGRYRPQGQRYLVDYRRLQLEGGTPQGLTITVHWPTAGLSWRGPILPMGLMLRDVGADIQHVALSLARAFDGSF
jgi:hypothetical protein